jgi:lysozyme
MNATGLTLIQHYESLHDGDLSQIGLQPKMDPVGIWTEGWGHVIRDSKGNMVKGSASKKMAQAFSKIKTTADADKFLLADLQPIMVIIARKITIALNEDQTAALASFIYNTGGSSTLYKLINAKSPKLYEWWTTHYITAQGFLLKGLVYRRQTEAMLFTTGKLKFYN